MNHPALLLGLINRVRKKQALASRHGGFDGDEAAILVGVKGEGFFVKWLLFHVGAVDEERYAVRVPKFFAAIPVRSNVVRLRRWAIDTGPLAFGPSKGFPHSAQKRLPRDVN